MPERAGLSSGPGDNLPEQLRQLDQVSLPETDEAEADLGAALAEGGARADRDRLEAERLRLAGQLEREHEGPALRGVEPDAPRAAEREVRQPHSERCR